MLNSTKTDEMYTCSCVIYPQVLAQNFKHSFEGVIEIVR